MKKYSIMFVSSFLADYWPLWDGVASSHKGSARVMRKFVYDSQIHCLQLPRGADPSLWFPSLRCSRRRQLFDSYICDTSLTGDACCLIKENEKLVWKAPASASVCKRWDEGRSRREAQWVSLAQLAGFRLYGEKLDFKTYSQSPHNRPVSLQEESFTK